VSSGQRPPVARATGGSPAAPGGGRALAPGLPRSRAVAVVLAVLVIGALAVTLTGRGSSTATSAARYGGLPSWLPRSPVAVGRVVTASAAHPALAIQGDTVSVQLAHGRVLATAVGPSVPQSGHFPVPPSTPAAFVLTFARTQGTVPFRASDVTIVDELGVLHHPQVTALGGGPPPALITPGRPVSVRLTSVLATGNGNVKWAPAGPHPLVIWDFAVEID